MRIKRNPALAAVSTIAALGLVTACSGGGSQTVSGEGSTAQQKAMEHFTTVLAENTDIVLNYTGSGSGDGIKKFLAGDVDFAGSDSPLDEEEAAAAMDRCNGNPAWHLPLVAGPVAIAYNLEGVDNLILSPDVVSGIFANQITTWNAPEIAALNPGVDLPSTAIVPVHRSDSSGTTDNFQKFLTSASPDVWTFGAGKEFAVQGGSGAAKSTGVADTTSKTPGSVTYVEWGFAQQYELGVAQMDFGSGAVELNTESAGKALDGIEFADPGSKDLVVNSESLFASDGEGAYPLVLTPYSIVCSTGYADEATSTNLQDAFTAILTEGQAGLSDIGYVELPDGFKATLQGTIDSLTEGSSDSA